MERHSRLFVKVLLLVFGIIAVLNGATDCCNWVNFGEVPVRPITATWMLMAAIITGIREIREGPRPLYLAVVEFALCTVGIVYVINSLSLFYYAYRGVPSVGTMLGFAFFWAIHLLLMIERVRHLKKAYFLVVLIGLIGLIGHIFDNDTMKYQFADSSNAMAFPSAVFLILLGLAAYSREREGP